MQRKSSIIGRKLRSSDFCFSHSWFVRSNKMQFKSVTCNLCRRRLMSEAELSVCAIISHFQDTYDGININQADSNITPQLVNIYCWNSWIQVSAPFMSTQKEAKLHVILNFFPWLLFAKSDRYGPHAVPGDAPASAREPLQLIGGEIKLVFPDTFNCFKMDALCLIKGCEGRGFSSLLSSPALLFQMQTQVFWVTVNTTRSFNEPSRARKLSNNVRKFSHNLRFFFILFFQNDGYRSESRSFAGYMSLFPDEA